MRMPGYPAGVPSQYAVHYHPWPTRFHGPLYQRPVFRMPWMRAPQNLLMPWQLQGLGNVAGDGGQYDVGDGIFKPGGYGGGIFDGNLSGLGADTAYPWGTYSADTLAFQTTLNQALVAQDYCALTADGKLGAATCGAARKLSGVYPKNCQKFTEPSKAPCTGSTTTTYVAPALPSSTAPSTATTTPTAMQMSMVSSGGWKKYAAFAAGALVVGGAAYLLTKKKQEA